MTDWRTALRNAAKRDEQDQLSNEDAQAMRRVVVAGVTHDERKPGQTLWMRQAILATATFVGIVCVGLGSGVRLGVSRGSNSAAPNAASAPVPMDASSGTASPANRQLQFMTAGGTRIIWVFNSDLDLKATVR